MKTTINKRYFKVNKIKTNRKIQCNNVESIYFINTYIIPLASIQFITTPNKKDYKTKISIKVKKLKLKSREKCLIKTSAYAKNHLSE